MSKKYTPKFMADRRFSDDLLPTWINFDDISAVEDSEEHDKAYILMQGYSTSLSKDEKIRFLDLWEEYLGEE